MNPRLILSLASLATQYLAQKKLRDLRKKNSALAELVQAQADWQLYLCDVLDRNGVEMDEFDAIVSQQFLDKIKTIKVSAQ